MIQIQMANGQVHDLHHHGSQANQIRWAKCYPENADIIAATVFIIDEDGIEQAITFTSAQEPIR